MFDTVKIAYRFGVIPVAAAVLCLLWSCDADHKAGKVNDGQYVNGITVSIATRAEGDGDGSGDAENNPNKNSNFNIDDLIPYTLAFDQNTILQVSQQALHLSPFQTEDAIFNYQYIPTYVDHEGAWDDENSYNFTPYGQDEPLEWNRISQTGSYLNGFAMHCLYFPIENRIRSKVSDTGAILYSVMEDQSTVENLKKSDILGGFHITTELFSRIKFRLFHLMTYIRIRLYVPVYDDEKNTGYREGSLKYATLDNVTPDFAIDWNYQVTPDDNGQQINPLNGDGSIKMYQHPLPEGATEHAIEEIKYKDFLPSGYYDQGIVGDYDKVRAYDFSVLLPQQKGIKDADGKETNFTGTEFLNFYLQTNAGGTTRYYFTQSLGSESNESVLEFKPGYFQYIELYVPRVGNQVVFVGAKVNPWNQTNTGMFFEDPTDWTEESNN